MLSLKDFNCLFNVRAHRLVRISDIILLLANSHESIILRIPQRHNETGQKNYNLIS